MHTTTTMRRTGAPLLFPGIQNKVRHGVNIAAAMSEMAAQVYIKNDQFFALLVQHGVLLTEEEVEFTVRKCTDFHKKDHINAVKFVDGINTLPPISHVDPSQFEDQLPQPYRMIVGLVEEIMDATWLEIIRRQPDLFCLPDGTPVHVPRNQAYSNVVTPSSSSVLDDNVLLCNTSSVVAVVGGLSFFTSSSSSSSVSVGSGGGDGDGELVFGVCDLRAREVLQRVFLSPIKYQTVGDAPPPSQLWKAADLKTADGGFWVAATCFTTGRPSTVRVAVALRVTEAPAPVEEPVDGGKGGKGGGKAAPAKGKAADTVPADGDGPLDVAQVHVFVLDVVFNVLSDADATGPGAGAGAGGAMTNMRHARIDAASVKTIRMVGAAAVGLGSVSTEVSASFSAKGEFLTVCTPTAVTVHPLVSFAKLARERQRQKDAKDEDVSGLVMDELERGSIRSIEVSFAGDGDAGVPGAAKGDSTDSLQPYPILVPLRAVVPAIAGTSPTMASASYRAALILSMSTATVEPPRPANPASADPSAEAAAAAPAAAAPPVAADGSAAAVVGPVAVTTLDVALLLNDAPTWLVLRGRFNSDDKARASVAAAAAPEPAGVPAPTDEVAAADVLLGVKPVARTLEMRVVEQWKLSSPCTAFAVSEGGQGQPAALALGLRDGSVAVWSLLAPARSLFSVLGQHSYRAGSPVTALQFWAPRETAGPLSAGAFATAGPPGGPDTTMSRGGRRESRTLRLISGAEDGTVCFFDVRDLSVPQPPPTTSSRPLSFGSNVATAPSDNRLRDYRDDFTGPASPVALIELLTSQVGLALVVLRDGRNAIYDVALGRLLARTLVQRGLPPGDPRNLVASYGDVVKRFSGNALLPDAPAARASGTADANTNSLLAKPLAACSGRALYVMFQGETTVAAFFDVTTLLTTVYPDLARAPPSAFGTRSPWAVVDLFAALSNDDRALLGVFKSGPSSSSLPFFASNRPSRDDQNPSPSRRRSTVAGKGGVPRSSSRGSIVAGTPGAPGGASAGIGAGPPTGMSLPRVSSYGSFSGTGGLASTAAALVAAVAAQNDGDGVPREPTFIAKKAALSRLSDRNGRRTRILKKLVDLTGDL